VTGNGSEVRFCKEQYCIGIWNVRCTNQGKLEVVKQKMARANIDILGISELKWTGMGKLNSDDHFIFYCGQESLRRNGVAFIVNKSPKCSTISKTTEWSVVFPILLFSSISLHWSLRKVFLSLLTILWNSAFKWIYLSFSHLPFASEDSFGNHIGRHLDRLVLIHFPFCISFSWGWFWSLPLVQCQEAPFIVLQAPYQI